MKKIIAILLVLIISLSLLCSCKKAEEPTEPSAPVEESKPEPEPEPEPEPQVLNPLTGTSGYNEAAVGKRPVAVMINNIVTALPQYGISNADILFEIPVEGEITRMMAIYADQTAISDVCSVRSCRYYYPIFALSFDAFYLHWGMDEKYAGPIVYSLDCDTFDGGALEGSLFLRDEVRAETYDWEHTGYLDGEQVPQYIADYEYRNEIKEGYESAFNFLNEAEPKAPSDKLCDTAVFNFSEYYYSTFEYNEAEKVYYKQHSGDPHMDQTSGEQLNFTNLFALETEIGYMDNGYHRYVDWSGGTGYYISNGAYTEITWEKADEYAPIIVKDAATGEEISVNAGKSYIGIIYPECTDIISNSVAVN